MKGLTTLSFFAFLYLVIIIIFNEVLAEPRGVQDKNTGQSGHAHGDASSPEGKLETKNASDTNQENQAKPGNVATNKFHSEKGFTQGRHPNVRGTDSQSGDNNPLADLFQITDPSMRSTLGAIYGSYKGNDQCTRKAFCMLGNYLRDVPGRDFIFYAMGNYVPAEYALSYEIFKAAVMYGQNCDVYVCIPDTPPPDAASAASRPTVPTTQAPQVIQPSRPTPPQQQQKGPTQKPQDLENFFDNSIPR